MGMTVIETKQAELVQQIEQSGELISPAWREAFQRVRRHLFVPRIIGCWPPLDGQTDVEVDRVGDPERWLDLVYSDRLLFILRDGQRQSSSSRPSVMVRFLELLDACDADRVLEIGTGSGYNAALLSERLGSERVTSIDIEGELVEQARAHLAECGYTPTVAVADGWEAYPSRAPYERIIATCSVPRIPEPWIEQLRPGGVIVTPLRGGRFEAAGLVALRQKGDGSLSGRLHPRGAAFLPMRQELEDSRPARTELRDLVEAMEGESRPCTVPSWLTDEGEDSTATHFFLRLHETADWEWFWLRESAEEEKTPAVAALDHSWARVVRRGAGYLVVQGGPRRLWDLVERASEQWARLGRPDMGRYGITVGSDGRQYLWLRGTDSTHAWEM
jgi:protein-L-isoaspartate(D-aspartate) O-methyltransferase